MANENEEVDQNEQLQDNDVEQRNEQITTGSKDWDKLIDDAAQLKTGTKDGNDNREAIDNSQQGKDKQQQIDPNKQQAQQIDNTQQRRQGDAQSQSNYSTRPPARKFGNLFQADQKGDIYDTNGALVAKQGLARSTFHRLWPTIEAQSRELNGLRDTVKNYTQANELAKREGLTLDEHGAALQMFVQWKKDPVKTMQTLLTVAEQGGRDVSAIRQATGPSIADFRAAVAEEVANAVKPFTFLTDQQKANQEEAELAERVQTEYQAFVEEFPDVRVHEQAIANVMRDKGLNAREAYFAVRAFAAERRLDWNKPLAEQLVAQEQRRNPSGDGQNRRQLPPMSGRNRRDEAHVENGALDQANASDSWDAIARKAMRKAGIEV